MSEDRAAAFRAGRFARLYSTAFGSTNSFLILSAIAVLGLAFAFTRMPETRPKD
jgi:hypothetical protein